VSRWLSLLGLALCGVADAIAPSQIDLAVTPAWNGWTRPGQATEVDIRLAADVATQATLDVAAGRQVVRANVDLEPGRGVRLQVPIESAEEVAVSAGSPGGPPQRREIRIAQSESPLLGVGVVTDVPVHLEGFQTITLAADDLPRNASAYASVDALILDGPTLGALDRRQLGALLAHAAGCGRIVLLKTDLRVRHVLDGAGGCGGRAVMSAASLAEAVEMLQSSLAASIAPAVSLVSMRELAQPGRATWNRVLVLLAAYFAIAGLALLLVPSLPVLLLVPALATVAILALLHAIEPPPQLVVWSEGQSGAQVARYQAWQLFPGLVRGHARVPVLPQFAAARSCESSEPMRFDFDASRGRLTFADFDTRLFRQMSLCYSGMFPLERTIAIEARTDALLKVRNAGRNAWPSGLLLAYGLVHDLPALGPGDSTIIRTEGRRPLRDASARIAMARTESDRIATLWEVDPGDVAGSAIEGKGWLLLTAPRP
jgi:hypothetical protein